MPAPESISIRAGLGPICTQPLVVAGSLSLTPIKPALQQATDAAIGGARTLKVAITNPSTTGTIAWQLVPRGTAAPAPGALVATYGAGAGAHILPGEKWVMSYDIGFDLVLVADSGANNYSVVSVAM